MIYVFTLSRLCAIFHVTTSIPLGFIREGQNASLTLPDNDPGIHCLIHNLTCTVHSSTSSPFDIVQGERFDLWYVKHFRLNFFLPPKSSNNLSPSVRYFLNSLALFLVILNKLQSQRSRLVAGSRVYN